MRLPNLLALAAFALAGALGATAAQASAANFTVNFAVKNNDASVPMIRSTVPLPTGVTGLIDPAAAILAGGTDPATGNAVYSAPLPTLVSPRQVQLAYAKASDSTASCTFTIKVSRDGNVLPYLLHFASDNARCLVPADQRTSDGQFTAQTSILDWASI